MDLVVESVTRSYGSVAALSGVTFRAGPGVLGLLGPNGSGKTTLLRVLATALKPDGGRVRFAGRDYAEDPRPLRRVIGYLPQHLDLPGYMTPRALLRYIARLKGVPAEPQASILLRDAGLDDAVDRPIRTLSGGETRLVGIAQALLGAPRLLILDEPLAGLDLEERTRIVHLLGGTSGDRVVVVSSHVPSDIEAFAAQVVVLRAGEVVAAGSPESLRLAATGRVYEVEVSLAAMDQLLSACRVSRVAVEAGRARLRVVGDLPAGCSGVAVEPTLEDAYLLLQPEATGAVALGPAGQAR